MPNRFGTNDTPACPECKNPMRLTRRTPHIPPPTLWRPRAISNDRDYLDRALDDLMDEDQWIDDFIKRLNYTIEDMDGKK